MPTCEKNLLGWLSLTVDQLNKEYVGVVACWEKTQLLHAWERSEQVEAAGKVKGLFPNIDDVDASGYLGIEVSASLGRRLRSEDLTGPSHHPERFRPNFR